MQKNPQNILSHKLMAHEMVLQAILLYLHYATLHYATLHYATLRYTTLHRWFMVLLQTKLSIRTPYKQTSLGESQIYNYLCSNFQINVISLYTFLSLFTI